MSPASVTRTGRQALWDVVYAACCARGRPYEAEQVLECLEEEWIRSDRELASLSETGWQEIRLPVGLKEELKRRLGTTAAAGPQRGTAYVAEAATNAATVGQDSWISAAQPGDFSLPAGARRGSPWEDNFDSMRPFADSSVSSLPPYPRTPDMLVQSMLKAFQLKGSDGLSALARQLQALDTEGSRLVGFAKFQKLLLALDLGLTPQECRTLWQHFDVDDSGAVEYEEVARLLTPAIGERRLHAGRVVRKTGGAAAPRTPADFDSPLGLPQPSLADRGYHKGFSSIRFG